MANCNCSECQSEFSAELSDYQKRVLKFTRDWVDGITNHNLIDDECLPDFSCCCPESFIQDRCKRIESFNKLCADYGIAGIKPN